MSNHIKAVQIKHLTKLYGIGEHETPQSSEFYGLYLAAVKDVLNG